MPRKIVRYFDGGLPTNRCNLGCAYCYVSQDAGLGWNLNKNDSLDYSIEHMKYALRQERLGGPCMFNFVAAGETLLFPQLYELVEMITSLGHYARIVTNGTFTPALHKLAELPETNKENLTIKFSMHYLVLKEKNLLDKFFQNIGFVKENHISYSVEICASDDFVPYVDEIKERCFKEIGALPHVVELRDQSRQGFPRLTKMPIDEYRKIWKSFDSPLFNYETRDYENYQSKFCYGGEYGITFSWKTGEASPCSCPGNRPLFNLFKNPDTPLIFAAIGNNCPSAHCFTNYVWSALVGNYPSEAVPTYEEERDRETVSGEHWLSPVIREIYSQRCSDHHEEYSESKKKYINALNGNYYRGHKPTIEEVQELKAIVEEYLQSKGIKNVAIYGMGNMGRWILEILEGTAIAVSYGIDRRGTEIDCTVPVYTLEEKLPMVDAVIVSIFANYNEIYKDIKNSVDVQVLSLLELANI